MNEKPLELDQFALCVQHRLLKDNILPELLGLPSSAYLELDRRMLRCSFLGCSGNLVFRLLISLTSYWFRLNCHSRRKIYSTFSHNRLGLCSDRRPNFLLFRRSDQLFEARCHRSTISACFVPRFFLLFNSRRLALHVTIIIGAFGRYVRSYIGQLRT